MEGPEVAFLARCHGASRDGDEVTVALEVGVSRGERAHQVDPDEVVGQDRAGRRDELIENGAQLGIRDRHRCTVQRLTSEVRAGAKITKKYDTATTPYARTIAHPDVKDLPKRRLRAQHASFNPAAVQRKIQALADELLTLAKVGPAHL